MELKTRIAEIIKYADISAAAFGKLVGVKTSQAIYDILSGKTRTVSSDFLYKVKSLYPEISAEWLITGEGDMLRTNPSHSISQSSSGTHSPNLVNSSINNYDPELLSQIADLQQQLLDAKDKIISLIHN